MTTAVFVASTYHTTVMVIGYFCFIQSYWEMGKLLMCRFLCLLWNVVFCLIFIPWHVYCNTELGSTGLLNTYCTTEYHVW